MLDGFELRHTIIFPTRPVAMGRPRFSKSGHCYIPAKTREELKRIEHTLMLHNIDKIVTQVALKLVFVHPRPQRLNGKKYPDERLLKTSRPDIDNLCKMVLDGCKSVWNDDAQVCALFALDYYASKTESAHTEVSIFVPSER